MSAYEEVRTLTHTIADPLAVKGAKPDAEKAREALLEAIKAIPEDQLQRFRGASIAVVM